jgi:DNA helicase-2/ATP-dependent DNA helicase PcrA
MKAKEIVIGKLYRAKVSDKITVVRVDSIEESTTGKSRYHVTNTATGRKTVFRSAMKFREQVPDPTPAPVVSQPRDTPTVAVVTQPAPVSVGRVSLGRKVAAVRVPELDGPTPIVISKTDPPHTDPGLAGVQQLLYEYAVAVLRAGFTTAQLPPIGWRVGDPGPVKATVVFPSVRKTVMEVVDENEAKPAEDVVVSTARVQPEFSKASSGTGLALRIRVRPVDTAPHLIVEARAGTGKTTTLVEGLRGVMGQLPTLTPSPQQDAVWREMAKSAGIAKSVAFVAFNSSIAEELKRRVPQGVEAMTMHSFGNRIVSRAFPQRLRLNEFRVGDTMAKVLGQDIRTLLKTKNALITGVEQLVSLCKMNLTELARPGTANEAITAEEHNERELNQLVDHYDVELGHYKKEAYELVPRLLELGKDVTHDGCMDYNDMIWLPLVLDLPIPPYDLLLVDEAQDLNRCQQELAKRAGKRLVLCGDPRQAIYGFAGADSESMPRMLEFLKQDARGCTHLPLTVTRRCGKAIVEEAKGLVPDFEAFHTNPEGVVRHAKYPVQRDAEGRYELPWEECYLSEVKPGDFILCRVNAPLVSQCFRLIRKGIKANIVGRNVGEGLVSTLTELSGCDGNGAGGLPPEETKVKLQEWLCKQLELENKKEYPSESRMIALEDRVACLLCFLDNAKTNMDAVHRMREIFTNRKIEGVRLSSIHRAKGLEAKRVFFLEPEGATCPHPMAKSQWQVGQEWNLRYVATTRAIEELIYVS